MLDDSLHSGLGRQLHQWRHREKLRQSDVAIKADLSLPTVRLLERDRGLVRSFHCILGAFELRIVGRTLPQGDSIGQQIALLRKRRRINQRDFAAMLDVCQDTVIALERSQGHLATLSKALLVLGAGSYLAHRSEVKSFYAHAGISTGQNEWTTPAWLIEVLVPILGRFDLDPCAGTHQPVTKARMAYTVEDDSLHLLWFGNVFVNPPYGRELGIWIDKMIEESRSERVYCLTALVPARTDTHWWHRALAAGASVFFLKGRLKFGNGQQSAPFPSALLFWGLSAELFASVRQAFPDAIAFRSTGA